MKLRNPLPDNIHPVLAETVMLCCGDDRSSRELCERAGIGHNVFNHWLNRRNGATVAIVDALLGVVGYKLAVVKITRNGSAQNTPTVGKNAREYTTIEAALKAYDETDKSV